MNFAHAIILATWLTRIFFSLLIDREKVIVAHLRYK